MSDVSSPDAQPPELSAVRLLNFGLRYWKALLGLPVLGFLLVAGWAAATGQTRYTAAAEVATAGDSPPLIEDSLRRALGDQLRLEPAEDGDDRYRVTTMAPSRTEAQTTVERYLSAWRRGLHPDSAPVSIPWKRLKAATAEAVRFLGRHPELSLERPWRRAQLAERQAWYWDLYTALGDDSEGVVLLSVRAEFLTRIEELEDRLAQLESDPASGRFSEQAVELTGRLRTVHRTRQLVRGHLLQAARAGALDSTDVRRHIRRAEDSLVARASGSPGAGERSSAQRALILDARWRLDLWRDVEALWRDVEALPSGEVTRGPYIASIEPPRPLLVGLLGLLGGALVGLAWAVVRESLRRGRELNAPEYREFRRLTTPFRRGKDGD